MLPRSWPEMLFFWRENNEKEIELVFVHHLRRDVLREYLFRGLRIPSNTVG